MRGCKTHLSGVGAKLLNHTFRWRMNPRLLIFFFDERNSNVSIFQEAVRMPRLFV